MNQGDKIQSIQWEKKEAIDVSDAEVKEVEQVLASSGGNTVNITVKKADGTTRQVTLQKERLEKDEEEEEEEKVKSYVLQGDRKVGYISLPAFYSDWEGKLGINGCANDVAKEIIKLKKENIEGLMIDLRYNGGGSLQEAIELSGIFIDAGPVAQLKTRDPKGCYTERRGAWHYLRWPFTNAGKWVQCIGIGDGGGGNAGLQPGA